MKNINPSYQSRHQHRLTAQDYVQGILVGDRYLLSQAITISESHAPDKIEMAAQIMQLLESENVSDSMRIAISGAPGVGKSTLIESLGLHIIDQDLTVAVLAVDPSSSVSRGSILGDKTRMSQLSAHESAYIRPSAAGSTLGGVHHATRQSIRLCEVAGFDIVLIETVGVGQSETIASDLSDLFLLLLLPGAGDEIQGIKRGIVELADIVVVNKVDQNNKKQVMDAIQSYRNALQLFTHPADGWRVPILRASGLSGVGIDDLWSSISSYRSHIIKTGYYKTQRTQQEVSWIDTSVDHALHRWLAQHPVLSQEIAQAKNDVSSGKCSAHAAIAHITNLISQL